MTGHVDWTEERKAKLRQMFADGVSVKIIGAALGVSKQAVARQCDREGLSRKQRPRKDAWSAADIETLKTMWAGGSSQQAIADVIGCSRNGVAGQILRLGLKRGRTPSEEHVQKPRSIKVAPVPYVSPPPSPSEPEFKGPLQDIPRSGCRFPRGDWQQGTFQCCGAETGGPVETDPYCSFHAAVCSNKAATDRANHRARSKAA